MPWFYTGIALLVISATNMHYLVAIIGKRNNNVPLKIMFTIANASILLGALSYKQNESNFLRNILYTNVRYKEGNGDILLTYLDD